MPEKLEVAERILEGGDPQDESDIPKEVPTEADKLTDPHNIVRGYKATISNPTVSEEARQHAKQQLEQLGEPYEGGGPGSASSGDSGQKDPGNVARGLKAAISNPGVSEEAKENAKQRLEEMGQ